MNLGKSQKEAVRMAKMSPEQFNKIQNKEYNAQAARTQNASDAYSRQYLRNVNPPPVTTKPKQPTPFEEYAAIVNQRTGQNPTQEQFELFMERVRQHEAGKQRAGAPIPSIGEYEAWTRQSRMTDAEKNAMEQARLEQFLARASQKGLSRETAQRLYRPGVS
jgi:hypothetical protein